MRKRLHSIVTLESPKAIAAAAAEYCRQFIADSVPIRVEQYAAAIGLSHSTPHFEQDVSRAILLAVGRGLFPLERFSDLRKQMLRVDRAARSAAKSLRQLQSALDELPPMNRNAMLNGMVAPPEVP